MSTHFGPKDILDIGKNIKSCYQGPVRRAASKGSTIAGVAAGAFFTAAASPETVSQAATLFLVNSALSIAAIEVMYLTGAYTYSTAKTLYNKYTP